MCNLRGSFSVFSSEANKMLSAICHWPQEFWPNFFQEFQWISMSGFALSRLKYAFKNCHSIESIVWKLQNETIDLLTNTPQCRPEWCTCLLLVLVVPFYDVGGQCKVVIYIRIDACRFQHIQNQLSIQNSWYIHRHSVPLLLHATILNEPSFEGNLFFR